MAEFFSFLVDANLITAAFIIGAVAFIIAVLGNIKTIIEPSPLMRVVLALFGIFLMAFSLVGYFFVAQSSSDNDNASSPVSVTASPLPTNKKDIPTVVVQQNTPVTTSEPQIVEETMAPQVEYGPLQYEETFDSASSWLLEGNRIENSSLVIVPDNDAVPHNLGTFTDFIFESRFYIPASGSMAFYLRHQQPPCEDWNCSIQLALYYGYENTLAARRYLGATSGKQEDIKKVNTVSIIKPEDWNTISVVVKGNTYEVFLNGVFLPGFTFTDNTYASGAFIMDNAGPGEVKIDYVRIYNVP